MTADTDAAAEVDALTNAVLDIIAPLLHDARGAGKASRAIIDAGWRREADIWEAAAKVVEAKERDLLSRQYAPPTDAFQDTVNGNIRMTTLALPELAAALRKKGGQHG